jgi:hypothetical protein
MTAETNMNHEELDMKPLMKLNSVKDLNNAILTDVVHFRPVLKIHGKASNILQK